MDFGVCLSAVGVFLFSSLCVLGSSLFALGSHFKGTPYLLPLMLTGRLLFGSGNGSLTSKGLAVNWPKPASEPAAAPRWIPT